MHRLPLRLLLLAVLVPFFSFSLARATTVPQERVFHIRATQFAFSPAVLRVQPGDRVTLILHADDVVHGLYIDGYAIETVSEPGQPSAITFVADRSGSFRLRCSVTCGTLHPFMVGKLQVGSNVWWWRGLGLSLLGLAVVFGLEGNLKLRWPNISGKKIDLLRWPFVRRALVNRWPQFILRAIVMAGFLLVILAGLFGTSVGNRNLAVVAVWIAWWALLILVAVPFLGRAWCSICPIPLPGEWLQNRAMLGPPAGKQPAKRRRWPRKLRNIWLQNIGFTLLALFSTSILTSPRITAAILAAMILLAVIIAWVYERRSFCRYLCPVGGFIGLYAQTAPIELRVKDTAICASHTTKDCYAGNEAGYGCPWGIFPAGMVRNNVCGLCFECLRTCEYNNLALNLRLFGADLEQHRGQKLDESFKNFIMLGSALIYAAIFLGPWGALKMAAYQVFSWRWLHYTLGLLLLTWVLLPGIFALATRLASNTPLQRFRNAFITSAYALTPMGLTAWVAFSLSFVFASLSYLWPTISDPFGWGWDLFGTAALPWPPYLTTWVPPWQILTLFVGMVWSLWLWRRQSPSLRTQWPFALYALSYNGALLWLLTG